MLEYQLDCDNLALEQQFFSPSRVCLALRAQIIDPKRRMVIGTRDFEIFEAAPSEDACGGVIAANRASTRLLAEIAERTNAVMKDDTKAGG